MELMVWDQETPCWLTGLFHIIEDTLRAIKICFNDSYLDANKRAFDLMVWDDNNGIPGNVYL